MENPGAATRQEARVIDPTPFESDEPKRRVQWARQAGQRRDARDYAALMSLTRDPEAPVRAAAYWALDQLRVRPALDTFLRGLTDVDFFARSNAACGLVHLGESVIPPVAAFASRTRDRDAREMAYLVLERFDAAVAA